MPIAIEVFETAAGDTAAVRIDINGEIWACVPTYQLPQKLAELGKAYAGGDLGRLLRQPSSDADV